MKHLLMLSLVVGLLSAPALASNAHEHAMSSPTKASVKKQPTVKAYMSAMERMHHDMNIMYSGNADVDFARGMVPHHQGAVDMANVLLAHSKDKTLRTLAQRIVIWQEVEIGIMKRWLNAKDSYSKTSCDCDAETTKAYKEAMNTMHHDMNIAYTGNVDIDFVNGMIPHHQGAIDMAWVLIKAGVDPELRAIAHDIIRSQEQEIALMKEWLKTHQTSKGTK
ncbi:MAG: DUF305 domain-containing protein [Rickettsiales bacterium]|nr:DUF305 domain-containing protein [Rickettsiales bacterium]